MTNRDDFTDSTKRVLAERVGYRCSNPTCDIETAGAKIGSVNKTTKIGVAAHITAAAPGGPRYDLSLTSSQRKDISNGIWLCHSCSVLIDRDEVKYTIECINDWKVNAELRANSRIGKRSINTNDALFHQAESERIKKFIQFIYDLFYEFEFGMGVLSTDVYYIDKFVFERIINFDNYCQNYRQDLRSYDNSIQNIQDEIIEIICFYKKFIMENNYILLTNTFKLSEDRQYYHSQELVAKVESMDAKLEKLANLVRELHWFRERR